MPLPGKPPASCGELFVAVWEGGYTNDRTEGRNDLHAVSVTVTRRVPVATYDREAIMVIPGAVIGLGLMGDGAARWTRGAA